MIDILSTMQVILRDAGFVTRLFSINNLSIISFEDEVLTGFGCVFKKTEDLLAQWEKVEITLLTRYAPSLRAAGDKAWNVYFVFLCESDADPSLDRQVRWIEEDLSRTRKIAATGLISRDSLVKALLPILPLQYQPEIRSEDATERLRSRIRNISSKVINIVLDESIPPAEVVRTLGGLA